MNIPTNDKRHLAFAAILHWVTVGANKRAGTVKYDEKSGTWEGENALGHFACLSESEAEQRIRQHPCKPQKATRGEPKEKPAEPPAGLIRGGLTMSDSVLRVFDRKGKCRGFIMASPGARYRLQNPWPRSCVWHVRRGQDRG